ncbi:hypothetical protein [Bacillus sp. FJAT-45037]|uniref:hypothetical protein n=1 Tax=Bacillus sp. FJAT-45037 TaxID=2011007 RepID=UPI001E5035D8|nr:hypothetical protein [Bacillus sp. FJAT-45037]
MDEWVRKMDKVFIPKEANVVISTSSKGDQSKWVVGGKWIKENTRGYENMAEYVASLVLQCSTLPASSYVTYTPCYIEKYDGTVTEGCYSYDFRGSLQEVTLERLFEAHFEATDDILNNTRYSTSDKFQALMDKVYEFTSLDVANEISQMLAFDAFILNEDRHTNNILFLFNPETEVWALAPNFDHGLSLLSDVKDYPLHLPLSILKRKVKAKPLNSSFSKQFDLYKGDPFIMGDLLIEMLDKPYYDLGRAKDVVLSQLKDPRIQKLIID